MPRYSQDQIGAALAQMEAGTAFTAGRANPQRVFDWSAGPRTRKGRRSSLPRRAKGSRRYRPEEPKGKGFWEGIGSGLFDAVGKAAGSPVGRAFFKGLQWIDRPRSAVTAGLYQTMEWATGDGFDWDQAWADTFANTGYGDYLQREIDQGDYTGILSGSSGVDVWGRRALGFTGDVGLDPLTYLTGGGAVAARAGKHGAMAAAYQLANDVDMVVREGAEAAVRRFGDDALELSGRLDDIGRRVSDQGVTRGLRQDDFDLLNRVGREIRGDEWRTMKGGLHLTVGRHSERPWEVRVLGQDRLRQVTPTRPFVARRAGRGVEVEQLLNGKSLRSLVSGDRGVAKALLNRANDPYLRRRAYHVLAGTDVARTAERAFLDEISHAYKPVLEALQRDPRVDMKTLQRALGGDDVARKAMEAVDIVVQPQAGFANRFRSATGKPTNAFQAARDLLDDVVDIANRHGAPDADAWLNKIDNYEPHALSQDLREYIAEKGLGAGNGSYDVTRRSGVELGRLGPGDQYLGHTLMKPDEASEFYKAANVANPSTGQIGGRWSVRDQIEYIHRDVAEQMGRKDQSFDRIFSESFDDSFYVYHRALAKRVRARRIQHEFGARGISFEDSALGRKVGAALTPSDVAVAGREIRAKADDVARRAAQFADMASESAVKRQAAMDLALGEGERLRALRTATEAERLAAVGQAGVVKRKAQQLTKQIDETYGQLNAKAREILDLQDQLAILHAANAVEDVDPQAIAALSKKINDAKKTVDQLTVQLAAIPPEVAEEVTETVVELNARQRLLAGIEASLDADATVDEIIADLTDAIGNGVYDPDEVSDIAAELVRINRGGNPQDTVREMLDIIKTLDDAEASVADAAHKAVRAQEYAEEIAIGLQEGLQPDAAMQHVFPHRATNAVGEQYDEAAKRVWGVVDQLQRELGFQHPILVDATTKLGELREMRIYMQEIFDYINQTGFYGTPELGDIGRDIVVRGGYGRALDAQNAVEAMLGHPTIGPRLLAINPAIKGQEAAAQFRTVFAAMTQLGDEVIADLTQIVEPDVFFRNIDQAGNVVMSGEFLAAQADGLADMHRGVLREFAKPGKKIKRSWLDGADERAIPDMVSQGFIVQVGTRKGKPQYSLTQRGERMLEFLNEGAEGRPLRWPEDAELAGAPTPSRATGQGEAVAEVAAKQPTRAELEAQKSVAETAHDELVSELEVLKRQKAEYEGQVAAFGRPTVDQSTNTLAHRTGNQWAVQSPPTGGRTFTDMFGGPTFREPTMEGGRAATIGALNPVTYSGTRGGVLMDALDGAIRDGIVDIERLGRDKAEQLAWRAVKNDMDTVGLRSAIEKYFNRLGYTADEVVSEVLDGRRIPLDVRRRVAASYKARIAADGHDAVAWFDGNQWELFPIDPDMATLGDEGMEIADLRQIEDLEAAKWQADDQEMLRITRDAGFELDGLNAKFDDLQEELKRVRAEGEKAKRKARALHEAGQAQLDTAKLEAIEATIEIHTQNVETYLGEAARWQAEADRLAAEVGAGAAERAKDAQTVMEILAASERAAGQLAESATRMKPYDLSWGEWERRLAKFRQGDMKITERAFSDTVAGGYTRLGWGDVAPSWAVEASRDMGRIANPKNQTLRQFLGYFDAVTNWFKTAAVMTPGFQNRNIMGGIFNNFLAGVRPQSYGEYLSWRRAYRGFLADGMSHEEALTTMVERAGRSEASIRAARLFDSGILTGGQSGEIAELVGRRAPGARGKIQKYNPLSPHGGLAVKGRQVTEGSENFLRGAMAWDTLARGGTMDDAIGNVYKYHFDYADLSAFEAGIARRVIPFYTWTRRNIPLQLQGMVTNPRAIQRYVAFRRNMEAGSERDEWRPGWVVGSFGFQSPWTPQSASSLTLMPEIPTLAMAESLTPTGFLSSMNPMIKVPLEYWTQNNFFTGDTFREYDPRQLPWVFRWAGPTLVAMGQARTDAEGNIVVSPRVYHVLQSLSPHIPRIEKFATRGEEGRIEGLLSMGLGVGAHFNDASAQRSAVYEQIEAATNSLRAEEDLGFTSDVESEFYRQELADREQEISDLYDQLDEFGDRGY